MNENKNDVKNDNKLSDIIRTSLDNIRTMVDANTVVGDPISTSNGTVVLPVSKLMLGFASGGLDYLGKNASQQASQPSQQNTKNMNFGGGGGTGLTVVPVAFLVVSPDGSVELLNINQPAAAPQDAASQIIGLIEHSPELIEKFKALFSKDSKKDKKSEPDEE